MSYNLASLSMKTKGSRLTENDQYWMCHPNIIHSEKITK